ncbi:hypothetical protein BGV40_09765 [Methanosarcina sp. Ant1]|nr:hypothetical protein BGV40_09765 [Methanosarcina sp. Ant1]
MSSEHLEILVEEPSMEAFLRELLPRMLGDKVSFEVYPFQCKDDLLAKLSSRLKGYSAWLPADWRIVVVVDRDDEDCRKLKQRLDETVLREGLRTRSRDATNWQVVNRIVIEELEAWYFGDWAAVKRAYPRVSANIPQKEAYRNPDAISGGTWEAFERLMKKSGYFEGGLRKIEAARHLGRQIDWQHNSSLSFQYFRDAVLEAL